MKWKQAAGGQIDEDSLKRMMEEDKEELIKTRIPDCCPFCKSINNTEWNEFEVLLGEKFYYNTKNPDVKHIIGAEIVVFCTACDEEIREEDI